MPIKPFETADAGAVMRLHAETFAGMGLDSFLWKPCQQIESLDADGPKYVFREGAEVTAYAAAYALDATHFRLNLIVAPSRTRRRLGTRLLDEIEKEVRRRGCLYLQARLLEAMPSSLAFALSRGFEEVHRMRGMTLRACDFDYGAWQPLGARLSAEGFRAATLKEERAAGGGAGGKALGGHPPPPGGGGGGRARRKAPGGAPPRAGRVGRAGPDVEAGRYRAPARRLRGGSLARTLHGHEIRRGLCRLHERGAREHGGHGCAARLPRARRRHLHEGVQPPRVHRGGRRAFRDEQREPGDAPRQREARIQAQRPGGSATPQAPPKANPLK